MGKEFYVLLFTEGPLEVRAQAFKDSLPHLTETGQEALAAHFLGYVTWDTVRKSLCPRLELPSDLAAAVALCRHYR